MADLIHTRITNHIRQYNNSVPCHMTRSAQSLSDASHDEMKPVCLIPTERHRIAGHRLLCVECRRCVCHQVFDMLGNVIKTVSIRFCLDVYLYVECWGRSDAPVRE